MVPVDFGAKAPGERHCPRIDILELKFHIETRIGKPKAEKYFNLVNSYLSLRISKSAFNKACFSLLGSENIRLHNRLIRSILQNACLTRSSAVRAVKGQQSSLNLKLPNGYQNGSLELRCRDMLPHSPRNGRTPVVRDRNFKDRPSPLGPCYGTKNVVFEDIVPRVPEIESATEILPLGSRPPIDVTSVQDGEVVEQGYGNWNRGPLIAPLGVCIPTKGTKRSWFHGSPAGFPVETCSSSGELPDTVSLKNLMEQRLQMENLTVTADSANLLNKAVDLFLMRLIKPCMDLASSRTQKVHHDLLGMKPMLAELKPSVSLTDLRVAVHQNPLILCEGWRGQLESVCLRASDHDANP